MIMRKIPRTMSTQHPDNVASPFFIQSQCFQGADEIKEAYYVFSHLACQEQMWDCEGKEVNEFVIKELLTRYPRFFEKNRIGRDLFITLRVPNPTVEKDEAKILLEVLESIPRSYDTAKVIYGDDDIAPIYEVILPMVVKAACPNRVYHYYRNFVAGKEQMQICPRDIPIKDWIGEFKPKQIQVIPLIEDVPYMLGVDSIVEEYLKDKQLPYMRVFIGRSDPALNYGSVAAVLAIKVALQRLYRLEQKLGIPLYPIVGVGACPFRGNFRPDNVQNCLRGYPSAQTFTIQSAFKYDYEQEQVRRAIEQVNRWQRGAPAPVPEQELLVLLEKLSTAYRKQLFQIVPLVKHFARYIPRRRMRKLHIGLFGYTRNLEGVNLPRVISFCAALYSIGLPPELLGLDSLSDGEWEKLSSFYPGVGEDLSTAAAYYNPEVCRLLPAALKKSLEKGLSRIDYRCDQQHCEYTSRIITRYSGQNDDGLADEIIAAASIRRFLG